MNLRVFIGCLVVFCLDGCGTINTTFRDDEVARRDLKAANTYCETIPRVYSGLSYGFCYLYAAPSYGPGWPLEPAMQWLLIDMSLSGVVDTALLPYTIYKQRANGSLSIESTE